jgi:hypothetical protein
VAVGLALGGCAGKGKPTKANFDQIKTDMAVKDVEDLMGPASSTGDTKAAADLAKGLPGGDLLGGMMPKLMIKQWEEGDTVYVVTFKDDKVVNKASGPKKDKDKPAGESKITRANADKIKKGMTRAEVEEILGPGKASADVDKAGGYVWSEGGKTIAITFVDGKVETIVKTGF